MWVVLYLNAEPWSMPPFSVGRGKGGAVYPKAGKNMQLASYQEAVRAGVQDYLRDHLITPEQAFTTGPVSLTIWFWRRKDVYTSTTTAKDKQVRKHHVDTTNMFKGTEDALQDLLFGNDAANGHTQGLVVDQSDDVEPCIVIRVEPYDAKLAEDMLPAPILREVKARLKTEAYTVGVTDHTPDTEWF